MSVEARGVPRRTRAIVLVTVCAGLAGLAVHSADDGLVYYRTPSEAAGAVVEEGPVRVGGMVVPGSVRETTERSSLVLTDGADEVTVSYPGRLPDVVREGEGAVVEGRWGDDGVLHGEQLLMRHSNEYRAPEAAPR
jgi:cytochrome c-type biogenesis protein CcmE